MTGICADCGIEKQLTKGICWKCKISGLQIGGCKGCNNYERDQKITSKVTITPKEK